MSPTYSGTYNFYNYNIISLFLRRCEIVSQEDRLATTPFSQCIIETLQRYEHEVRQFPELTRINHNEVKVFDMSSR